MIHIEPMYAPASLSGFQADWERLFKIRPHEPSTSFEWTQALRENHLKEDDEFFLLVGRQSQRVCALVPLVRERLRLAGLPLTSLRVISELSNTHSDFLCDKLDEGMMAALLESFRTEAQPWMLCVSLECWRVGTGPCPSRRPARSGFISCSRLEPPSFFLSLPDTFDAYLHTRSGKLGIT